MTKIIYDPSADTISRYPRADDGPIKGLEPPLVVLTEIILDQPAHTEQQYLEATRVVDLEAGTLTRGWIIKDRPPEPPQPRWVEFGDAVMDDPGVSAVVDNSPRRLAIALGVGLGQAAQGDAKTFGMAWRKAIAGGLVDQALAEHVASMAQQFDLPAEFVAGLNPLLSPEPV